MVPVRGRSSRRVRHHDGAGGVHDARATARAGRDEAFRDC